VTGSTYADGDIHGLKPILCFASHRHTGSVRVGSQLLGRIVDGACNPLDGLGRIDADASVRLTGTPINPCAPADYQPLDVGVRAINGLLTIGADSASSVRRQRRRKSVLLGMMARYTART